jgi:hypothetical protein
MWTFIKKLIPARIIVRSWYWVSIQEEMEEELEDIFLMMDIEDYECAKTFIADFHKKYNGMGMPFWVSETHAQICRAEAMLIVLSDPLIEEDANK